MDMDIDWSFRWLSRSLHSESESTIFAIQDQVICTHVYQAKIMRSPMSSVLCRLCGDQDETIQHVLAGCSILAPTCYLNRHNLVAKVLHFHLCKSFHIPVPSNSWFTHRPLPVIENDKIKILWDFDMVTDVKVSCNWPDIVIFLKQDQHIMFLEVSCPADINVVGKENGEDKEVSGIS